MRKIPRFKEMFVKDYIILGPTFTGILFIGLSIYFYFAENNLFGFYGMASVGVVSLIIAMIRLLVLRKLFTDGVEVDGQIQRVSFYRQSCRLVFEFDFDAEHIKTAWITLKNQKSRNMRSATDVKLLVNPKRPKQAIILDLFDQ